MSDKQKYNFGGLRCPDCGGLLTPNYCFNLSDYPSEKEYIFSLDCNACGRIHELCTFDDDLDIIVNGVGVESVKKEVSD